MSRKGQSYRNNSFRKLTAVLSAMIALGGNMYKNIFHNKNRNTGKAGGHLDTSYPSGGNGYGKSTKMPIAPHKAAKDKKRRRKEVDRSKSINRKRKAGMCSFKSKA